MTNETTMQSPIDHAMARVKEAYDTTLESANAALSANPFDLDAYNSALNDLDKTEKEYAKLAACALYDECAEKENPIIEVIKAYTYTTIGHVEVRDPDDKRRVIMVESTEKKRQIDLLQFCTRAKLPKRWAYTVSKFNQLMCMRTAKLIGADCKKIATTYYLREVAESIDMGKTPTSTTQVCKALQKVIDEILPNDNGDGKPIYKVNNYDVCYLDMLYGKKSTKELITISVSKDTFLRRVLVDIAYRLITGGKYGVDGYKVKK